MSVTSGLSVVSHEWSVRCQSRIESSHELSPVTDVSHELSPVMNASHERMLVTKVCPLSVMHKQRIFRRRRRVRTFFVFFLAKRIFF